MRPCPSSLQRQVVMVDWQLVGLGARPAPARDRSIGLSACTWIPASMTIPCCRTAWYPCAFVRPCMHPIGRGCVRALDQLVSMRRDRWGRWRSIGCMLLYCSRSCTAAEANTHACMRGPAVNHFKSSWTKNAVSKLMDLDDTKRKLMDQKIQFQS